MAGNKIPYKFTPMPEVIIDFLLPVLNESELKVFMFIIRSTYGFQKASDAISMSQFKDGKITKKGKILCRGTGLSLESISKAIFVLEKVGLIMVEKQLRAASTFEYNNGQDILRIDSSALDDARLSYSGRPRTCKVSDSRRATFLQNRPWFSIDKVEDSLGDRKTVSTETKNNSKNKSTDTDGTKVPSQASPEAQKQKNKKSTKTKDTVSDSEKASLVQRFVDVGMPAEVAEKHVATGDIATLECQLGSLIESSPDLRRSFIDAWKRQYKM